MDIMNTSFVRLHPADDVVITRAQLMSGSTVDGVAVRGLVPPGHKVATRAITVRKQIGSALRVPKLCVQA